MEEAQRSLMVEDRRVIIREVNLLEAEVLLSIQLNLGMATGYTDFLILVKNAGISDDKLLG